MLNEPKRRPGDHILDRYCPNLTPEERELAHQRLRDLARVLIRIAKRQAEEARQADSRKLSEDGTI